MRVLLLLVSAAAVAAAALRKSAGEAGRVLAEGAESGGPPIINCGVGASAVFNPATGSGSCKCAPGYGGITSCKPCAAGTISPFGTICLPCPVNTYSPAVGAPIMSCSKCPPGTSTKGATGAASAKACVN